MTAIASADITRLAEALRKSGRDANATTQQALIESANFLLTEMEVRVPVKSGNLRRSLSIRVEGDRVIVGPTAAYAAYVEFDTRPHEIKPKNPNGVLVFQVNGKTVYARKVHHPGTRAQPFVRPAYEEWRKTIAHLVGEKNVKNITREAA